MQESGIDFDTAESKLTELGENGMIHNESNIPAEWIKPECWHENKTHGFILTQNRNVLFHVLNDYSYNTMLRELAFRVDFLSARIAELEEAANVELTGAKRPG